MVLTSISFSQLVIIQLLCGGKHHFFFSLTHLYFLWTVVIRQCSCVHYHRQKLLTMTIDSVKALKKGNQKHFESEVEWRTFSLVVFFSTAWDSWQLISSEAYTHEWMAWFQSLTIQWWSIIICLKQVAYICKTIVDSSKVNYYALKMSFSVLKVGVVFLINTACCCYVYESAKNLSWHCCDGCTWHTCLSAT